MKKMLFAATLSTIFGLTGCATTEQPDAPAVAATDAGTVKQRDQQAVTGSRIPGTRSSMVSATDAADAQRQIRDNASPFTLKQQ
jgi:hypothetical protein